MVFGMIEVCPACRYSLRGLPEKHSCPECGFRYDRNACLLTRPRLGLIVFGATSAAMLVTGVALWWWLGEWVGRGMAPSLFVSVGLMGVLASAWRLRRSSRFIVVSRDELRVVDCRYQEKSFPMNEIADAEWSRISGAVTVTAFGGRELIVIPPQFLGSHRRSKLLSTLVKRNLSAGQVAPIVGRASPSNVGSADNGYGH